MIEISHLREKRILKNITHEVQEIILGIIQILDTEYGANRNKYEDDGGYVVVEKIEDFKELENKANINCHEVIAEYVDKIGWDSSSPRGGAGKTSYLKNMIPGGEVTIDNIELLYKKIKCLFFI